MTRYHWIGAAMYAASMLYFMSALVPGVGNLIEARTATITRMLDMDR